MPDAINETNATSASYADMLGTDTVARLPLKTLGQADFLKLLVAQMTSQDPMNPVSNNDFFSQMTEFNSLQQTTAMQSELMRVRENQDVVQANSLLGRTVGVRVDSETIVEGVVEAVGIESGTPKIIINGQPYDLSDVLMITAEKPSPSST